MNKYFISAPASLLPPEKYKSLIAKVNKTHIVCPALKKGIVSYAILVESDLFKLEEYFMYCDIVNRKLEVGCFHPRANVSLMPLYRENSEIADEIQQLKEYLRDAFAANQEYLECERMIFAFDDSVWTQKVDLYAEISEAADKHFKKFELKNIAGEEYFLKNIEIHIL
jgi:hypothetical protein